MFMRINVNRIAHVVHELQIRQTNNQPCSDGWPGFDRIDMEKTHWNLQENTPILDIFLQILIAGLYISTNVHEVCKNDSGSTNQEF